MNVYLPSDETYVALVHGATRMWVSQELQSVKTLNQLAEPEKMVIQPTSRIWRSARNLLARVEWISPDGHKHPAVLKIFRSSGLLPRLRRILGGGNKARRAWEKALRLAERGISTSRPLALIERAGLSALIMEEVAPARSLRAILKDYRQGIDLGETFGTKREFLTALAGFIRKMHDIGVWHRDLSGGNILVQRGESGDLRFVLVDVNRLRLVRSLSFAQRILDLERVRLEAPDQSFFFQAYCRDDAEFRSHLPLYQRRIAAYRKLRESRSALRRARERLRYYLFRLRGLCSKKT